MAQFTWTGSVSDEYANASNWDPMTGPPGFGDTVLITFGTVDASANQIFSDNYIAIASTTGLPATLVFDNDATTGLSHPTIADSTVSNHVSGQTTEAQTVLDANGTFVNQGTIIANAVAPGSTYTINVDQNGANPGYFINQGLIEADAGNTLDIVVGATSEILNSGLILANGGSVLITTSGSGQIVGGYAPIIGLVAIQDSGTVEFNAALPYDPTAETTTSGPRYSFVFTGGTNDLLKLDQVSQFSGNILGFQAGDTIDLGSLVTITSLTYNQYGVLTLSNNSGVVASLDLPGDFETGTFDVIGGVGGSFTIGASVGGDTVITTGLVNDTWTDADGLWSDSANWSGGVPAATGVAVIGNGTAQTYTITTGSASAGTLLLNDPNATLEVDGMFQVFPGGYDSTVSQIAGTIQIDSGDSAFIYALRQIGSDTALDLQTGASLLVEGRPNNQLTSNGTIDQSSGGNRFGLGIEGAVTIDGATINAGPGQTDGDGGSILIGEDGAGTPATVTAETDDTTGASVTDTYSILYSSPTSYGSLTITGTNTVWDDAGDPADTENTRGYMLIGQNDQDDNTPTPPYAQAAVLTVSERATLDEASYANIGNSVDSSGIVTIDDATWNIGNVSGSGTAIGFLQVGRYGNGSLTIEDDGTVAIGAGGTIVNDGTSQTVGYAVDIGHNAGASGTLTLTDDGHLTTLGDVIVGDSGNGQLLDESESYAALGGSLLVGGNKAGAGGGTGEVSVTIGSRLGLTTNAVLAVWQGSTVYVDHQSALNVGGSNTFVPNELHIDSGSAGSGLRGDGTVEADVENDGNVHATNDGTYSLSTGGLLDITGTLGGTGTAYIENGATLEVGGALDVSQQITFDANSGLPETFILGSAGSSLGNGLNDLQDGDRIELSGLDIQSAGVTSGTTVTVDLGGGGTYLQTDVHFAPDSDTGFITGTDSTTGYDYIQVTCFAAGTRIATPDGAVPVEELCAGQSVVTVMDGTAKPIVWIGRRRIDCRRHPSPESVWPVRIREGAFGPGLPLRDLFVSPDHALFTDGVLIPAKYLVDGRSVAQVPMDTVTYHHIELTCHDVVLAEGLPAETYLDTDGRASFDNGRAPTRLHPDLSSLLWEAKGCAPLVVTGPVLAAACARLGAPPGDGRHALAA